MTDLRPGTKPLSSLFPFIRRVAYALALLVFGLPAFPFWIAGIFLNEYGDYGGDHGYFYDAAVGVAFFGLLFAMPLMAVASGVKWVFTGRGFDVV